MSDIPGLKQHLESFVTPLPVSYQVRKLTGDASNREYYRISFPTPTDSPGRDRLILMKFHPADRFKSEEAAGTTPTRRHPFCDIQAFLSARGVPVPAIYLDASDDGMIFLEDLGDDLLYHRTEPTPTNLRELYLPVIETLVRFQKATAGDTASSETIAYSRAFTHELLLWECEHYLEWGIEASYQIKIPSDDRAWIMDRFGTLCHQLTSLPQRLVHRDFQSKNLMWHDDRWVVIDFQDALLGPLVYDLVALLRDSYVELPSEAMQELLLAYYARALDEELVSLSPEDFTRAFLLQTLQRKLKDAGRFVYIDRVKKNPSFLTYIPASLRYVNWAFSLLPEYADLRKTLCGYDERLRA